MLCPQCGTSVIDGDRFCRRCGRVLQEVGGAYAIPTPGVPVPTSGKATASLVFGLFFFIFPSAIAAIVLGHWSLSEIKHSAGRLAGQGRAIAGLVLGYMGIAAIPLLIVAAIAIPNLLRARIAANEATAAGAIRIVNAAEAAYQSAHPNEGYNCDLSAVLSEYGGDLDLMAGKKRGYIFKLQNCTAESPGGPRQKYQVSASPETRNQTGERAFCSDQSGIVRFDPNGSDRVCLESGETLQ